MPSAAVSMEKIKSPPGNERIMNREKKKARFNFIDAVIILIILAIIAAAAYLIVTDMQQAKNPRQTGNMDFTVRISAVSEAALSLFEQGAVVKDSVTGEVIGEIAAVRSEKTRYFGNTAVANDTDPAEESGYTVPVSEYDDKYDVYVTVIATAGKDARGIHYVGNTKILVGSTVYFKIPSFASISYVTEYTPMITE